jgi:hypothetical protein
MWFGGTARRDPAAVTVQTNQQRAKLSEPKELLPPLILATSSDCRSLLGLALGQKVLQPKVSNRAIAKTLGVDEGTIRNDRAEKSARTIKVTNQTSPFANSAAENSARSSQPARAALP